MKSQRDKDLARDCGVAFCHLCLQGKQFYPLTLYIYYSHYSGDAFLSFHFSLQYWQRSHKPTGAFLGRRKGIRKMRKKHLELDPILLSISTGKCLFYLLKFSPLSVGPHGAWQHISNLMTSWNIDQCGAGKDSKPSNDLYRTWWSYFSMVLFHIWYIFYLCKIVHSNLTIKLKCSKINKGQNCLL